MDLSVFNSAIVPVKSSFFIYCRIRKDYYNIICVNIHKLAVVYYYSALNTFKVKNWSWFACQTTNRHVVVEIRACYIYIPNI